MSVHYRTALGQIIYDKLERMFALIRKGTGVQDAAKKAGIDRWKFYEWRKKYSGIKAKAEQAMKEAKKLKLKAAFKVAKKVKVIKKVEETVLGKLLKKPEIKKGMMVNLKFKRSFWIYSAKRNRGDIIGPYQVNELENSYGNFTVVDSYLKTQVVTLKDADFYSVSKEVDKNKKLKYHLKKALELLD